MQAVVFHEAGKPLTIETVSDPEPAPGELVLRVKSCGICGSDLHMAALPSGLPKDTVMGHEFAGEIVEVASDVAGRADNDWKVGDRVCALPYIGCGTCQACLSGDGTQCGTLRTTGLGQLPGAYAEFVRVGAGEALRLPESVSYQQGALVEPLSVGLHAVNQARLEPGANVLVIGAGPIGLATASWARFFGARNVIVSEKAAGRLELADRFGATGVINASKEVVAAAFQKQAGRGPDVIFECVGVPGLLQQCIMMAPARSRIVVVGVCMQPDTIVPGMAIVKEISLHFVVAYRKQDFEMTVEMLRNGRIGGDAMVTDVVSLDGFADAFEALKQPSHQCKVILVP